jgi:DHA2 family multidrug resistance protein
VVLLFGALVTVPQSLQTVLGYTAENAGLVLSGGGAVVRALMPIVGILGGKYPAKYIIAAGRLALAVGMYVSTVQLDTLISFNPAAILRLIQSVGLGHLFVPVTMAGYIGMPGRKSQ